MKTYQYNNLIIEHDELESSAIKYAELYHYDKRDRVRPQSVVSMFHEEFGECDDPGKYMGLFQIYLTLCEQYKADPEIIAKYQEEENEF